MKVGSRLFLAFSVLAASTIGLALVGWFGLANTRYAVAEFEQQTLPDIARSLELAERTANLAAVAPYVASINSPFLLGDASKTLRQKIDHVIELADSIPELDAFTPELRPLLNRLEKSVDRLIDITRNTLFLREDLRQQRYQLHRIAQSIQANPAGRREHCELLANWLLQASRVSNANELSMIEAEVTLLLKRPEFSMRDTRRITLTQPLVCTTQLVSFAMGDQSTFRLVRQQLQNSEQSAFLLASTRAISEQLTDSIALFVENATYRLETESQLVSSSVKSGQTGILLISLMCFLALAAGIWVVRELGAALSQITANMTQLAEGDTGEKTPATERRDELGELARAFQIFRENSLELERVGDDLRGKTQLLEAIFLNINDGLSVFDQTGKLLAWNPQYLALLELKPDSVHQGMHLDEIHRLLPEEARASWTLMGTLLDKDEVNEARYKQAQKFERHFADGRLVEFNSSPMPGGGFVTLYSDLTDRKAIEAQLRQSQKMEVLGQLTGGVAHDFNNLLAALFGNLQLSESKLVRLQVASDPSTSAPQEQTRHDQPPNIQDALAAILKLIRRAQATAERGNQLNRRLLAFSRKQQLDPLPTSIDALISDIQDLLEYSIASDIDLKLLLDTEGLQVLVDAAQLENALLNLAINASAAMPDGGQLIISTEPSRKLSHALDIVVTDTGCGIAEEHLARVFEPFFTTKDIGEGSGLGLSMVYGFVKQSQGDIQVESTPGLGTSIRITLPTLEALDSPHADTDDSPYSVTPPIEQQITCCIKRILLIEDDDQLAMVTEDILKALGIECLRMSSAEAAIDWLMIDGNQVDLILSDINLGAGLTGVDLMAQAFQTWPELPVLLTSGLPENQLRSQYLSALSTEAAERICLLPKPYHQPELVEALNQVFHLYQGSSRTASGLEPNQAGHGE